MSVTSFHLSFIVFVREKIETKTKKKQVLDAMVACSPFQGERDSKPPAETLHISAFPRIFPFLVFPAVTERILSVEFAKDMPISFATRIMYSTTVLGCSPLPR